MTTINQTDLENLEKFILWFTEQDEIPAKTRRDFIAHIMKIGHIDEHSAKFIDKTMHYLEHKSTEARKYWEKDLAMWQSFVAAENNEETSLQVRDVKEAEKIINEITDEFVEDFKAADKAASDIAESGEKSREISEIDAIKAALN